MNVDARPERDSTPARRLAAAVAAGLVALGILLRVRAYGSGRSLWLDEAMLALNLLGRSWRALTEPLADDQVAPLGFLFAQKALVLALGGSEWVLRLLPLVAGIAAVPLAYRVARRCTTETAALLALALFAVSPAAVSYAAELKQYSTDVLVAVVLYAVAARSLEGRGSDRDQLRLGAVGAVALWCSHPATFVLGGIGCGLVARDLRRRSLPGWSVLLAFAAWAASFLVMYLGFSAVNLDNRALTAFWDPFFMPLPPWRDWEWFVRTPAALLADPVGLGPRRAVLLLGGALALAGLGRLLATNLPWGIALGAPLLLVAAAAGLRSYPLGGRLMLFAVPSCLVLVAAGVDALRALAPRLAGRLAAAAIAAVLLAGPLARSLHEARTPSRVEHVRPLVEELRRAWREGDVLYVYYGARPALAYYAPALARDSGTVRIGRRSREDPARYLAELDALRGHPRAWILFSHNYDWGEVDEREVMLRHLDRIGRALAVSSQPGASLHLYDLAAPRGAVGSGP